MHLVDALARVRLITLGEDRDLQYRSVSVPFVYARNNAKMTLLVGEAARTARQEVASKLGPKTIAALRRPLNAEQPQFQLMQQLSDAGISKCPLSGTPIFDPSKCAPKLRTALWRVYCGVAATVNTRVLGQTATALDELDERLREHVGAARSDDVQAKHGRDDRPLDHMDEADGHGKRQCIMHLDGDATDMDEADGNGKRRRIMHLGGDATDAGEVFTDGSA